MSETKSDVLIRHANILRSIRLMALSRRGITPDENRMMEQAINDLDMIAEQLEQSADGAEAGSQ